MTVQLQLIVNIKKLLRILLNVLNLLLLHLKTTYLSQAEKGELLEAMTI